MHRALRWLLIRYSPTQAVSILRCYGHRVPTQSGKHTTRILIRQRFSQLGIVQRLQFERRPIHPLRDLLRIEPDTAQAVAGNMSRE